MSAQQAKFISGDGVEHEVPVESYAFEIMSKDGSFRRLDLDPSFDPDLSAKQAPADRSRMKTAELVAEAEILGLDVVPGSMTKVAIIEAIEAKLTEPPADEEMEGATGQ